MLPIQAVALSMNLDTPFRPPTPVDVIYLWLGLICASAVAAGGLCVLLGIIHLFLLLPQPLRIWLRDISVGAIAGMYLVALIGYEHTLPYSARIMLSFGAAGGALLAVCLRCIATVLLSK